MRFGIKTLYSVLELIRENFNRMPFAFAIFFFTACFLPLLRGVSLEIRRSIKVPWFLIPWVPVPWLRTLRPTLPPCFVKGVGKGLLTSIVGVCQIRRSCFPAAFKNTSGFGSNRTRGLPFWGIWRLPQSAASGIFYRIVQINLMRIYFTVKNMIHFFDLKQIMDFWFHYFNLRVLIVSSIF